MTANYIKASWVVVAATVMVTFASLPCRAQNLEIFPKDAPTQKWRVPIEKKLLVKMPDDTWAMALTEGDARRARKITKAAAQLRERLKAIRRMHKIVGRTVPGSDADKQGDMLRYDAILSLSDFEKARGHVPSSAWMDGAVPHPGQWRQELVDDFLDLLDHWIAVGLDPMVLQVDPVTDTDIRNGYVVIEIIQ